MPRYIVRYSGKGQKPAAGVERLSRLEGSKVLDESSRMLLLDVPERTLMSALETMPDWIVAAERSYAAPRPSPILGRTRGLKPSE